MTLSVRQAASDAGKPHTVECDLAEAIETLCYDYLAINHDGWENDNGAYGQFRFDVETRTVMLTFNQRFAEIDTTTQIF